MIQSYRELKAKRSASEMDESGFTLIELLIVIVVLGILAAIVVFALSGVTGQSTTAACQSDAKTVGIGVAALQAENPTSWQSYSTANWQTNLSPPASALIGSPFLQSWPTGNSQYYTISVAGKTGSIASNDATPITPTIGDVVVTSTQNKTAGVANTYDATVYPVEACQHLASGT
jgi:prepilin-type N-terminal cleavage/methylation domain-containing protein